MRKSTNIIETNIKKHMTLLLMFLVTSLDVVYAQEGQVNFEQILTNSELQSDRLGPSCWNDGGDGDVREQKINCEFG